MGKSVSSTGRGRGRPRSAARLREAGCSTAAIAYIQYLRHLVTNRFPTMTAMVEHALDDKRGGVLGLARCDADTDADTRRDQVRDGVKLLSAQLGSARYRRGPHWHLAQLVVDCCVPDKDQAKHELQVVASLWTEAWGERPPGYLGPLLPAQDLPGADVSDTESDPTDPVARCAVLQRRLNTTEDELRRALATQEALRQELDTAQQQHLPDAPPDHLAQLQNENRELRARVGALEGCLNRYAQQDRVRVNERSRHERLMAEYARLAAYLPLVSYCGQRDTTLLNEALDHIQLTARTLSNAPLPLHYYGWGVPDLPRNLPPTRHALALYLQVGAHFAGRKLTAIAHNRNLPLLDLSQILRGDLVPPPELAGNIAAHTGLHPTHAHVLAQRAANDTLPAERQAAADNDADKPTPIPTDEPTVADKRTDKPGPSVNQLRAQYGYGPALSSVPRRHRPRPDAPPTQTSASTTADNLSETVPMLMSVEWMSDPDCDAVS